MPEIRDSRNQFKETLLITETRMLILSTCKKCGAAKLVSAYDGSRKEWQDNHKCKEAGRGSATQLSELYPDHPSPR
jgi:hypothetical protein